MKVDRRDVHPEYSEILHYQRIHTGLVEGSDQPLHTGYLVIVDEGVDRGVDSHTVRVGEVDKTAQVVDGIGGSPAGAMAFGTYVYSVSPGQNGRHSGVDIPGRS